MLYRVHLTWAGFELAMLMVTVTDCIGSNTCKSNFQMITTTSMIKSINFIISMN
jgi:hypothetical protein